MVAVSPQRREALAAVALEMRVTQRQIVDALLADMDHVKSVAAAIAAKVRGGPGGAGNVFQE